MTITPVTPSPIQQWKGLNITVLQTLQVTCYKITYEIVNKKRNCYPESTTKDHETVITQLFTATQNIAFPMRSQSLALWSCRR